MAGEPTAVEPTPAVLSGGIDLDVPDIDPQKSQMQEARDYGNTVVSRLLGIPAPLLHVSTSGATITYVGAAGAIEELVKATLAPTYMPPLEFALRGARAGHAVGHGSTPASCCAWTSGPATACTARPSTWAS